MLRGDAAVESVALKDRHVGADAYVDFSPSAAVDSTHPKARAVCSSARVGGPRSWLGWRVKSRFCMGVMIHNNLQIRGSYMYA